MEYVGDVIAGAPDGGECLVRLKNRFYVGDALEVLTPEGPRAFTVSRMTLDTTGESVQTASVAGTLLRMPIPGGAGAATCCAAPAATTAASDGPPCPLRRPHAFLRLCFA